jgi:hypothetical protein
MSASRRNSAGQNLGFLSRNAFDSSVSPNSNSIVFHAVRDIVFLHIKSAKTATTTPATATAQTAARSGHNFCRLPAERFIGAGRQLLSPVVM